MKRSTLHASAWLLAGTVASATSAAPLSGAPPSDEQVRKLHEQMLVLDTHLDTPANLVQPGWNIADRHSVAQDGSQVDLPRMLEGGLDGGFWAIYTAQGPRTRQGFEAARDQALIRALAIRELAARDPRHFELALTSSDAARIAAAGKRIVYLSIENGYPLGLDASLLRTFHALGVRLFGPVHFRNNDLGDSATDPTPEWHGLSPLGKRLVADANRLGIVLDASHASDDVLDQMLELSRTPVMLSHSGCRAVFDHPRNVDDDRLRQLAAKGGVIQMNSLSGYLTAIPPNPRRDQALAALNAKFGPEGSLSTQQAAELRRARRAIEKQYPSQRATFEDFMKHVLHALRVVGPEHVGIGADWDGGGGVTGLDDVASLPKITARLLQEGYSPADIEKIWSGNALRVLAAAEAYAKQGNR